MNRFRLVALLATLALLASVTGVVQATVGRLFDFTGRVDLARFESSVHPLVEDLAVIPVAIVYDGTPNGEESYVFDQQVLADADLYNGNVQNLDADGLAANVVALSLDFGGGNLNMYLSDNLVQRYGITLEERNAVIDEVAKYARQDVNRALSAGFDKVRDLMDPPLGRFLRALPGYLFRAFLILAPIFLILFLLVRYFTYRSYRARVNQIEIEYDSLTSAYEGARGRRLDQLLDLLGTESDADEVRQSATTISSRVADLVRNHDDLGASGWWFLSSRNTWEQMLAKYKELQDRFSEVELWVAGIEQRLNDEQELADSAETLLGQVEQLITQATAIYESNRTGTLSQVLPDKSVVFQALTETLASLKDLVLYQGHKLAGARQLVPLKAQLEALPQAMEALKEAMQRRTEVVPQIESKLAPYAGRFDLTAVYTDADQLQLKAVGFLHDDLDFVDVVEPARAAVAAYLELLTSVEILVEAITKVDQDRADLARLEQIGHRFGAEAQEQFDIIEPLLKQSVASIAYGDYPQARLHAVQAAQTANNLALAMIDAENLRLGNEKAIAKLSEDAVKLEVRRLQVSTTWEQFTGNVHRSNWADLSGIPEFVRRGLLDYFDDPSSADDLYGRLSAANRAELGQFANVAADVAAAARDLIDHSAGLDQLEARMRQVRQLQDSLPATLVSLRSEYDRLVTERDVNNALLGKDIDDMLADVLRQLETASHNFEAGMYLGVGRQVEQVRSTLGLLDQNARGQLDKISKLRASLSEAQRSLDNTRASAMRETISLTHQLQTDGLELWRKAEKQFAMLGGLTGFEGLEDHALAAALRDRINLYEEVLGDYNDAQQAMLGERKEYQRYLNNAIDTWRAASAEIERAESLVSDPDSDREGQTELNSAKANLPAKPADRQALAVFEQVKAAAEDALSFAKKASKLAQSAIDSNRRQKERESQVFLANQAREQQRRRESLASARSYDPDPPRRKSNGGGGGGGYSRPAPRPSAPAPRTSSSSSFGKSMTSSRPSSGSRTSTKVSTGGSRAGRKF